MGTKLGWIRSLFVTNLALATTTKDLFNVFKKAGPVFDVFLPKDRRSGQGKGFGFVQFKTEWDANRAIKNLNGRVVCGRRIGVQVTKELNRNIKYSRPSKANRKLEPVIVNQFHERGYWKQRQSTIDVEKKNKEQVWIEEEGGLKVVKIANSLASSLKQEVRDSYVATVSTIEAFVSDVQEWLLSKGEIQVEVKRINWSLF
eukprot:TRINITY_DN21728_c0_g2_i4.p1 TRINITY_DN21728_c0_g2~~TRINITY_DN21728_c0_g2_i4.p1  ORF type:complete len:201 (+),score=32.37 TRINITY_DN21728_c0_g2_i4:129-731(+)